MPLDKAVTNAAEHLTSGATLDELKTAAEDLRALSPDSVLADAVEDKIEQILKVKEQPVARTKPEDERR